MWFVLQTIQQSPQLLVLCEMQTPLQTRLGEVQVQEPKLQVGAELGQTLPQIPQLLASVLVLISQPSDWRLPLQLA